MTNEPTDPPMPMQIGREDDETRVAYRSRVHARRQRAQLAVLVFVAVIASLASGFSAIAYTKWAQNQSDARWCSLVGGIDERNKELKPPPPNAPPEAQQQYRDQLDFAKKIHALRVDLGCP